MVVLSELPNLKEVFKRLRSGFHICEDDRPMYSNLRAHYAAFRELFAALDFDLLQHERGFFYFQSEGELRREASMMAVFFFVLVEAWADAGVDIEERVFAPEGHGISNLPHFTRESWKQSLEEVGVADERELLLTVKRLGRYGFVEFIHEEEERFRFRTPTWRFLDMCLDVANGKRVEVLESTEAFEDESFDDVEEEL
jgi:chromosome condensin MukBEF MukE localization factor